MAKLTLLDMVQDIANDLDTEEINSINDTVESVQIAQILKTSYFELIANRNWPHLRRTIKLDSVSDTLRPTHLQLPILIKEMLSFTYDKRSESSPTRAKYEEIKYLEPEHFLVKTNNRNVLNTNVDSITDFGGVSILIMNDRHPEYYTSFDDNYIICDSFNSDLEDTLQSSKTQAIAYVEPAWTHTDSFIPDLPSEAFPLLLEEAKSTSFLVLKQVTNEKAEQKARRQNRWLSRKSWRVSGGVRYPDYGRKTVGYQNKSSIMFDKDN
jgi:hypothetical protein